MLQYELTFRGPPELYTPHELSPTLKTLADAYPDPESVKQAPPLAPGVYASTVGTARIFTGYSQVTNTFPVNDAVEDKPQMAPFQSSEF